MKSAERIEKTTTCKNYLQGIEIALDMLLDTRFPSWEIRTALDHVRKAKVELEKEIDNLNNKTNEI